jgi:uncharacterized membrane protein SpoIIM required for sporulation
MTKNVAKAFQIVGFITAVSRGLLFPSFCIGARKREEEEKKKEAKNDARVLGLSLSSSLSFHLSYY